MSDGAFEARVSAKRETSAGIFLTLEIQPSDYGQALAMLRVGSALQVGWAEIVDTAVHKIEVEPPKPIKIETLKDRRKFSELSAANQAGMLCDDARFTTWLCANYNREWDAAHAGLCSQPDQFGVLDVAARVIRALCGVKSRADIPINPVSLERWQHLLARYEQYKTDQMAEAHAR